MRASLQTAELPSQADDLDGDGKYDELVFQIDLAAGQTRIVTIAYGDQAAIQRLRGQYPERTAMKFATRYEGLGWESEDTAWRIYFDKRNAIDIYGKRRPGLYLDMFAAPEYVYHLESPMGRDIFRWTPRSASAPSAPSSTARRCRWRMSPNASGASLATGPVRSIGEFEFKGWKIDGKTVDMVSRFTQWAGEHGFEHRITVSDGTGLELAAALPKKPGIDPLMTGIAPDMLAVVTWGHQVVVPGTKAGTTDLPDENLGLAVMGSNSQLATRKQDAANYLLPSHPAPTTRRSGTAPPCGTRKTPKCSPAASSPITPPTPPANASRSCWSTETSVKAGRSRQDRSEQRSAPTTLARQPTPHLRRSHRAAAAGRRPHRAEVRAADHGRRPRHPTTSSTASASSPKATPTPASGKNRRATSGPAASGPANSGSSTAYTHDARYRKWAELWTCRLHGQRAQSRTTTPAS